MFTLLARAGALATVPAALAAQGPVNLPPDWTFRVEQGVDTYLKGGAVVKALVMAKELPASSPADVEAVTTRLFSTLGCRGAPPASRDGVIASFGEGTRCFATFRRSPGGYRVAIGLATAPGPEAEAKGLARQLTAAGAAAGARGAALPGGGGGVDRALAADAPVDVRTIDAQLAAALDAVPASHLPVHMSQRSGYRYTGENIELNYTLWMLFANGVATTCTQWDPATTAPTEAALAPVMEEHRCKTTRWRRVGTGAMFDDEPKAQPSGLEDGPPPPRGTTFQGNYDSSQVAFTSLSTWGVPGQLLLNSSAMSLTRDGQFRLGSRQYAKSNLEATTRGTTIAGRYLIDKYLMAISVNGKIERHFFYALGKPEDKELLFYFDGKLLSDH